MSVSLARNHYGISRVRLLKVARQPDRHDVKQLSVGVQFEGDFESGFRYGDNTRTLPADTVKNTIQAYAKLYSIEQIEDFARQLAEHFLTDNGQITKARVEVAEDLWERIVYGGKPHATSFRRSGMELRTAVASGSRDDQIVIESGIENLPLLRTAGCSFENFIHDPFTTLEESEDRILPTSVKAVWSYSSDDVSYGPCWHGVREALIQTFVEHESKSVRHTLYAMAEAVLLRYAEISEVTVSMPDRSWTPVDLSRLCLENQNEVFAISDSPNAVNQARVVRR